MLQTCYAILNPLVLGLCSFSGLDEIFIEILKFLGFPSFFRALYNFTVPWIL